MPRFERGNVAAAAHGRPRNLTADYLDVTFEECDLASWRLIVKRAVLDARGGNPRARSWLSGMLIPDPTVTTPTPGLDVEAVAELVSRWLPNAEDAREFALSIVRGQR